MKVRVATNLLEIPPVEELNVRTVTEAVSSRWRTLKCHNQVKVKVKVKN